MKVKISVGGQVKFEYWFPKAKESLCNFVLMDVPDR